MRKIFRFSSPGASSARQAKQEIDLHIELRTKEFIAQGMSPEDAREAALAAFGDRASIEAQVTGERDTTVRARNRRDWFDELRMDLTVGWRSFMRSPGFTIAALLTLAIGIGANTAMFSVVRSVMLRPLPYDAPEQLVQIWADHRALGRETPEWHAPPDLVDVRNDNRTFSTVAAYGFAALDLTGTGEPETLGGLVVNGDYLDMLGAKPAHGRLLTMSDDVAGAPAVVVLSDGVWRRRFGADPSIVNTSITLNGTPRIVVGVLPREFQPPFTGNVDVIVPFARAADAPCQRGCVTLRAIGRMKPGVTLATAHADVQRIFERLARDYPATNAKVGAWLIPLHEQITGASRTAVYTLTGAVALVLLIGCVNLAGLLLVRGAGRTRELSVRAALGAGRGRIVRQLLTEHALLAMIGGALGLALGVAASGLAAVVVPAGISIVQAVRVDWVVILFSLAVTMFCAILFGVTPALYAARRNIADVLRGGARTVGGSGARLRSGLVVTQLTFAVVLLVGAGLLMRSFMLMQRADVGYRTNGVVLTPLVFAGSRFPVENIVPAATSLIDGLRANPAIRNADLVDIVPLSPGDNDVGAAPVGDADRTDLPPSLWMRSVTNNYFTTMQYRLVAGRQFNEGDRQGSTLVGVINEEAARRYFPGKTAVGRQLSLNGQRVVDVIGVIANDRHDGAGAPLKPEMFVPYAQRARQRVTLVVEPASDTTSAIAVMRAAIRQTDPMMPIGAFQSMDLVTRQAMTQPRVYATLVAAFAAAALLLAALGVYGVQAYSVARREREIGVRLALGATPSRIRNSVLRDAGVLAGFGLVAGLGAAIGAGKLASALLYGVNAFDSVTVVAVGGVLAVAVLIAAWVPAQRAVRIDPLASMRDE